MKTIEFNENDLPNISEMMINLIMDEKDPKSNNYKRILVRPKIHWSKIIAFLLVPVFIFFAVSYAYFYFTSDTVISVLIFLSLFLFFHLIFLKKSVICCIRIYQRYAPDSIRNNCRFEPSCSQYFILSLEKYGFIKGCINGIKRLKRCNYKNGGFDYP